MNVRTLTIQVRLGPNLNKTFRMVLKIHCPTCQGSIAENNNCYVIELWKINHMGAFDTYNN